MHFGIIVMMEPGAHLQQPAQPDPAVQSSLPFTSGKSLPRSEPWQHQVPKEAPRFLGNAVCPSPGGQEGECQGGITDTAPGFTTGGVWDICHPLSRSGSNLQLSGRYCGGALAPNLGCLRVHSLTSLRVCSPPAHPLMPGSQSCRLCRRPSGSPLCLPRHFSVVLTVSHGGWLCHRAISEPEIP